MSIFQQCKPSEQQVADMTECGEAAEAHFKTLKKVLRDGPDKTYVIRQLRDIAMWANQAILRNPDGSPRNGESQS